LSDDSCLRRGAAQFLTGLTRNQDMMVSRSPCVTGSTCRSPARKPAHLAGFKKDFASKLSIIPAS
jgi:hypothetical protein